MAKKDDLLWKGILEEIFDDFLLFMHPDAGDVYDLDKGIEFLDKELEQLFPPEEDEFAPKVVDKLAKVYTRAGAEEWILVHVEVQGRYQRHFPKRMFTYYYRILDKYNRPITAYAIFTDGSRVERPNTYETEHQGTSIRYRFNTYHINQEDESKLLNSENPFALAVLVGRSAFSSQHIRDSLQRDAELLSFKIRLLRRLVEKQFSDKKIRALMNFLRYYVRFENEENISIFEQQIEEIKGRTKTMGIEELILDRATKQGIKKGLQQGEQKKSQKFVKNLIQEFGFTDEQAAKAAEVSLDFVRKIRTQLDKKK